ncbi:MAG: quinol:cytochrome C oxidoreductase [Candidatus Margulisiibacteriota bacterium]
MEQHKLTGFLTTTLPRISGGVGLLGLAASFFFYTKDAHHFFYSYLMAFTFFLTLTLGSLFFVLIQFLVRAGWSVVLRRLPEVVMKNFWIMAIFFIPILFGAHDLYHWMDKEVVAADKLLQWKSGYLNLKFFLIRAAIFFGIWIWLSSVFFKGSVGQDTSGDPAVTLKLQKYSTFGVLLFALSLTFAGVDWVMSLTPHWYSTMFGVYFFAGSMVSSLCLISIMALILRAKGFLKDVITVEHYHDLGKLIFGFNIFWTYIAFGQYFLIWYANVPEETEFFMHHFAGSWNSVGILLAVGHFAIPLILFMSRYAKRNLVVHFMMACWIVLMQLVDVYWLIMPNAYPTGVHITAMDIAALLGIGGIFVAFVFHRLGRVALYPVRDPRLAESRQLTN